ncbi:acyltransferase [Streptomyces laurentii]|uniref:acyltransferase n=1 Tax=Streptomyces laurentii TaxID=39478 RepID=UPI0036A7D93C
MMGSEDTLRLTVAALMASTGQRQGDLAAGLGQGQAQVSRKQAGRAHWTLADADALAAHYRLHVLDLLAGPAHALGVLLGAVPSLQQAAVLPPARASLPGTPPAATPSPAPEPTTAGPRPAAAQAQPPAPCEAPAPAPAPAEAPAPLPQLPLPLPLVPADPCVLCGQPATDELDGFPQHLSAEECAAAVAAATPPPQPPADPAPAPPATPVALAVVPRTPPPAPAPAVQAPTTETTVTSAPRRSAPGYASSTLTDRITDRVREVLAGCEGDTEAAQAELVKAAIPDVMALLKLSRVGGRYEHSEFPPSADILQKKSQKGADQIWEGRPKWRNPEIHAAAKKGTRFEVTTLDMNAAYLSALKCWLPIGRLREETGSAHDPKKSGVHLITPPAWDHPGLPNPLGNRQEPGELWVPDSLLRQLLDCARQGMSDTPVIHRSLVSGATEGLLEKMRRALAEVRKNALAEGDELTVDYVKSMYSKFVSTIGESSSNREIRRPDWMHNIRSKAFTNLWLKAHKAHKSGLQVVQISGTDELHVVGDWRTVFEEGRELNQVKAKDTYILGGRR